MEPDRCPCHAGRPRGQAEEVDVLSRVAELVVDGGLAQGKVVRAELGGRRADVA